MPVSTGSIPNANSILTGNVHTGRFNRPNPNSIFGIGVDQLGLSDEDLSSMISDLLRNLGTQQSQASNRASELTVNAPLGTQLAAERNVNYNTALAGQQGITGLQQFQSSSKRDAFRTLLDARLRKYGIDAQSDAAEGDIISDLLGSIGGGAGFFLGNSLFGGNGNGKT